MLCCGYTLTDFPISIRLTSLALWQSNDCPSASKATLMNMDKYFMWIHCERSHNHNKAKHNKTVCIFLGIYCTVEYTVLALLLKPASGTTLHVYHRFSYHTASPISCDIWFGHQITTSICIFNYEMQFYQKYHAFSKQIKQGRCFVIVWYHFAWVVFSGKFYNQISDEIKQ